MSDALCRIVTAEGWSRRSLFTDEDATVFECRCVVAIAGINLVADRPDLLDRSLIIGLEPVSPEDRRDESSLTLEYQQARPQIVGGILDALAMAMQIEPELQHSRLPRMADAGKWGAAAAEALGMGAEGFIRAYDRNVGRQNETAIEASSIAQAVLAFVARESFWRGTMAHLLELLIPVAHELGIPTNRKGWPSNHSWLGRRLKDVETNLLAMGIEVVYETRTAGARLITLRKISENAVTAVTTNPDQVPNHDRRISGQSSQMQTGVMPNDHEMQLSDGNDTSDSISGALCGSETGEQKVINAETGDVHEADRSPHLPCTQVDSSEDT